MSPGHRVVSASLPRPALRRHLGRRRRNPPPRAPAMIRGIGIDIVATDRMQAALERHSGRMKERLFTAAEIAYCDARHTPVMHYAARFAAKEAFSKALGTGMAKGLAWKDFSIERAGNPSQFSAPTAGRCSSAGAPRACLFPGPRQGCRRGRRGDRSSSRRRGRAQPTDIHCRARQRRMQRPRRATGAPLAGGVQPLPACFSPPLQHPRPPNCRSLAPPPRRRPPVATPTPKPAPRRHRRPPRCRRPSSSCRWIQ